VEPNHTIDRKKAWPSINRSILSAYRYLRILVFHFYFYLHFFKRGIYHLFTCVPIFRVDMGTSRNKKLRVLSKTLIGNKIDDHNIMGTIPI
jgi:hypothetical protein